MNIRWLWISALVVTIVGLSACTPPVGYIIKEANRQNDARAVERGKGLLAEHLKMVDKLRAEGDPMGDYLWTRANADRLIPNPISDPLVLKKMYEEAASKGSVDAQHALGLMLFNGSSTPSGFCTTCPVLKPEDRNPQLGVELIDKASAKQCFYWSVELDGMANRQCLTPVVTALYVWPKYRDGRVVSQSADEAARWKQIELSCRAELKNLSPQFFAQQKFPACR